MFDFKWSYESLKQQQEIKEREIIEKSEEKKEKKKKTGIVPK